MVYLLKVFLGGLCLIIMSGHMVMRNVLVSCMLIMKHKKELLKHRLKHFKKLFLEINKRIGVTRKLNVAL